MSGNAWSLLLAAFGITGLLLGIRGVWWGWALNLAAQVFWFVFAIVTAQYGFIITAVGYGATYTYGAVKTLRARKGEVAQ